MVLFEQHPPQSIKQRGVFRLELHGFFDQGMGPFEILTARGPQVGKVILGGDDIWFETDGFLVFADGLVGLAFHVEGGAEVEAPRVIRLESQGLLDGGWPRRVGPC